MTTQTHPPITASPESAPLGQSITLSGGRAALDALIAAGGHELRLVRTIIIDVDDGVSNEPGLPSYIWYRLCATCGASTDEDAAGMDVDARLLVACVEPTWISYNWADDRGTEGDT